MVRKADPCALASPACARACFCCQAGGAMLISQLSRPGAVSGCRSLLPSVIFSVKNASPLSTGP